MGKTPDLPVTIAWPADRKCESRVFSYISKSGMETFDKKTSLKSHLRLAMGGNGNLSSTPCLDSRLGSYSLRTGTSGDPVNLIECGFLFRRKAGDSLSHLNYGIQSLGEERERYEVTRLIRRGERNFLLIYIYYKEGHCFFLRKVGD